ncbi:MAG: hypothetical protein AB7N91_26515 [Candidatus Tectimicrobiota bacterium]
MSWAGASPVLPEARCARVGWYIQRVVLGLLGLVMLCTSGVVSEGSLLRVGCAGALPLSSCSGDSGPVELPRRADYLRARQMAWAWLDQLEVDPIELARHEVKGKKKLAEILEAYVSLYRSTADRASRRRIEQRVFDLAAHTRRPEYHDMLENSESAFLQNSMSYLRVLWLLECIGQDTTFYRQHVLAMKERLDAHIPKRGIWQQAMFAEYYDRFGLQRPAGLLPDALSQGLIARRVPLAQYQNQKHLSYQLTHEIFVVFDYGLKASQSYFAADDVAYIYATVTALVQASMAQRDDDILAELLRCMAYFGWRNDPLYWQGNAYLLDHQNADGTWGNYESLRQARVPYVEQRVYLHTTLVALQALLETYETARVLASSVPLSAEMSEDGYGLRRSN